MAQSIEDMFTIEGLDHSPGQVSAILIINQQSPIFCGHFPAQPVVPGACMVQLVKDVLCTALHTDIVLKKAANIKFINMITPHNTHSPLLSLTFKIGDDDISVNAKITIGDVACFKLQATYTKL